MGRHKGGGARLRDARGRPCRQWFELGVHQKCDGKPVPVCKHVRDLICFLVTTLDHAASKCSLYSLSQAELGQKNIRVPYM